MKNLTSTLVRSLLALWLTTLSAWAVVTIDPPTRTFTKDGGGGSILTSGSGTWTASANVSWLTLTPRTSGNAGDSCIYVVNSNLSADTRQGIITLAGNTHTVTQTGYPATLTPALVTINLAGGSRTVAVTTSVGVSWTAVSNAGWITVSTPSGIGSGTVAYTVAAYTGVTTRTGSLIIGNQTFTVTQTGTDVNILPYSVDKAYSSDIVMVAVSALSTTNWNVTSNDSWISVVDPGNKFGNSTVTLGIGTNPSFLDRTGTVQIGSATFTIHQSGTPNPILDILPKVATAEATGAYGNIAVFATPDAPWTAETLSSWIILSNTIGAGNGNIGYVASANPALSPRTGTVRVYAPAVLPRVDLTLSLLAHVPTGPTDVSGWMRHPTGAIETRMDGSFCRALSGPDLKTDIDAGSVAIRFRVETVGAIQRIFGLNANSRNTALYINADNYLVFHSGSSVLVSNFTVEANKDYHVIVTASAAQVVCIYAGEVAGTIRQAGTSTFSSAPFLLSVATPASAVKLGYADLPSSGYLNGGVLKDFRLYGRTLNSDEVTALFAAALTAAPYGPVATPAINPVVSYNLRDQAVATGGSLAPTSGTLIPYTLMAAKTSGLTNSMALIHQRDYNDSFSISSLAIPVTSAVSPHSAYLGGGTVFYGGTQIITVSAAFLYEDYTTQTSVAQDVAATQTASGTYTPATATTDITLTFTNPIPQKWVKSVSVSAKFSQSARSSSYTPTFSYSVGAITVNIPATTPTTVSGCVGFSEAQDRFSAPQRALKSAGTGELRLWSHQSSFASQSATYSFWLRCDALPTTGTRLRLFKRAGLLSHLLTAEIDSAGNILYSDGTQTVTLNAGIKANQWQMLTLTGAYGANLTAFVDGAEVGNTNVFSAYNFGTTGGDPVWMRIGGWSGSLGNVAFYDGALSSTQVKSIYDAEKAIFLDHVVTQGVVNPSISPETATLPAAGGTTSSHLALASNVNWTAASSATWLQLTSSSSGAGSSDLQVFAAANPTVTTRSATVTIAGKVFTVTQAGLPAAVACQETIFTTDGGSAWVDVTAGGNAQWDSSSNASWLTVALGATGLGSGEVFIVADPYTDTSRSRTGTVTVAGSTLYFTQRGYALSISPQVAQLGSNSGAGEFGVAAPLSAIWEAIATQPWITLSGGTMGIGNGTLRYTVATNTTGQTRTGKIIVSGVEYNITQVSSLILTTTPADNGTVSGAGSYNTNALAVLTATPSSGYIFSHWTGDAVGSANPLSLSMDCSKNVTANFIPAQAADSIAATAVQGVINDPNPHGLYTPNQMRALAIGKPVLQRNQSTGKFTLNLGIKKSTNLNQWLALPITGSNISVNSNNVQVEFASPDGAAFFRVEGNE